MIMNKTNVLWVFLFGIFLCVPPMCKAQVSYWDGSVSQWTQGAGTEDSPYLLTSAQNLAYLASSVNNGLSYAGTYFKLTTDVDLQSLPWTPIGAVWTFYGYPERCFKGVFDGDNHLVDHLYASNCSFGGLFGVVGAATIRNVRVNATVGATTWTGYGWSSSSAGVVSFIYNNTDSIPTRIENCHCSGNISTAFSNTGIYNLSVGGIVGGMTECPILIMENCTNNASLSTNTANNVKVGGLLGGYDADGVIQISNCHNFGSINVHGGSESKVGGIAGYISPTLLDTSYVVCCSNSGEISVNAYYGYVGGIVGYSFGHTWNQIVVDKCFNQGGIHQLAGYPEIGGIIGVSRYGRIHNCFNTGSLSGYDVGGITGANFYDTVRNCYNTGILSGQNSGGISASSNFGGDPEYGSPVVLNSYYLNTCGGSVNSPLALTDSVMKSVPFTDTLNTDSVVYVPSPALEVNDGYPVFGSFPPVVMTLSAGNITTTSAILRGYASEMPAMAGFRYREASSSAWTELPVPADTLFQYALIGLQSGSTYYYQSFVQINGILHYGQERSFHPIACDLQLMISLTDSGVCQGDSAMAYVNVSSDNSDVFSFLWDTGETTDSLYVGDDLPHVVTVIDSFGCIVSDTVLLNVWPTFSTEFTISISDSCLFWNDQIYCQTGDYTQVFQTVHGCDSVVTMHLTVSVGVDHHQEDSRFYVYPNPTVGRIALLQESDDAEWGEVKVQVLDNWGRLLQTIAINKECSEIDLSSYSAGYYLLLIVNTGQTIKIIKQ